MIRTSFSAVVLLVGFILLFTAMINPGFLMPPMALLVGWWPAMARLAHAWQPTFDHLLVTGLAVALLVAGAHRFLGWVCANWNTDPENPGRRTWRWKWTLCGFGMLFCGLLAICSVVLTAHQLYWLSKSPDPMVGSVFRESSLARFFARTLQSQAEQVQWDTAQTRGWFEHSRVETAHSSAAEEFQALWVPRDESRLRAVILFPRHPLHHRLARIAIVQPGTAPASRPLDDLPAVLAAFGIGHETNTPAVRPSLLP